MTETMGDTAHLMDAQRHDAARDGGDGDGWRTFAGTMLGLAGVMRIFDAFWAFDYDGESPQDLSGGVAGSDLDTYGWIWLVVGMLLVGAGVAVIAGSQVARWVGIAAAAVGALSAMAWMPYYPVWSLTYVGLAVLVLYALAAHGGRRSTA